MNEDCLEHEKLVKALNDPELRKQYESQYQNYKPVWIARALGWILVTSGNMVYGYKPSYGKFKAVEVIARIPYQSWEVAMYTILTGFYGNEKRAIELAKTSAFSRSAQDNETMHVVVVTQLTKGIKSIGFFRHTLIPLIFAFFYFWAIYILYLFSHRASLELNFLFESHAYEQYSEFLELEGDNLKHRKVCSDFLAFYGRECRSEYELFESIRNDELIHRNRSIHELEARRSHLWMKV